MPQVDLKQYAEIPPAELEAMRTALVKKAAGSHDNLDIDDLHQLAAITGILRSKASGPPKAVKTKTEGGARRAKPAKAELNDLA